MNQAHAKQSDEAGIPYVEPEEPKTNPRIRAHLPLVPEPTGVVTRVRVGVSALSRLRFAPAVVIGALVGSAPYLVQEHARARATEQPAVVARELPEKALETSQLAAAAAPARVAPVEEAPARAPAPQPPPSALDEVESADLPPVRPSHERALLQRARQLLSNGDAFGAQLALERLAQRSPHAMVEQRKLLEIRVLWIVGGKAAAQRAASDFAKAYPRSRELTKLSGLLL